MFAAAGMALISIPAHASCSDMAPAPRTSYVSAAHFAVAPFGLDADGILYREYGAAYGGLGKFHNPYFIAQYAAALYRDYLDTKCEDDELRQRFLLQSDWLINNALHRGEALVWTYPFPHDAYDLKPGWISGITQARIALVLVRAAIVTGEDRYHQAAEAAMLPYLTSIDQGGVVSNEGDVTWIEEMPHPSGRSFKVLNGHITALANIKDFAEITGEERWRDLYERGLAAVKRDIAKFDAGYSSRYSLDAAKGRTVAELGGGYNQLHIEQLLWMFDVTKDPLYLDYAALVLGYEKNADAYTAKGSIDAETHGPSQAKALYKSAYWSHATFPTWLQVDLPRAETVRAFQLDSHPAGIPKEFSLEAKVGGIWKPLFETKSNESDTLTIAFDPIEASAFRLNVASSNGKLVAIQAAMPIRVAPKRTAIVNHCNWRTNAFAEELDGSLTLTKVLCPGFVLVPMNGGSTISFQASGKEGEQLTITESDDLQSWSTAKQVDQSADLHTTKRWVKIEFSDRIHSVGQIATQ